MEELLDLYNDVMESCECDPMGMNNRIVIEAVDLDVDPDKVNDPAYISSLKARIKKVDNLKSALKMWSRLTSLLIVVGGATTYINAGVGNTTGTLVSLGVTAVISLVGAISVTVQQMTLRSLKTKNENDLTFISKTLGTNIESLKRKQNRLTDKSAIDVIEKEIIKAESLKNKVDTVLDEYKNDRDTDRTDAIKTAGNRVAVAHVIS